MRIAKLPLALAALVPGLLLAAAPAGAGPVQPGAAQDAHIRLAHLSPDTPEMDVYVAGNDGKETRVLQGLGYGEVSDYATLPPGSYTFLLRPKGAPADSTPAVTASADLKASSAYTFAAMGPHANLQKALLTDDIAPPPAGKAKVRLIQASSAAGDVDVTTVNGPALAEHRAFATATGYAAVASGPWTVDVSTSTGTKFQRKLSLDPGTVNTLVVLQNAAGKVDLTRVVDATGTDVAGSGPLGIKQAAPLGGIDTGGGGLAKVVVGSSGDDHTTQLALVGAAGAALALAGATTMLARRRARP
jgi:Domain of unknown function (DUF4397)